MPLQYCVSWSTSREAAGVSMKSVRTPARGLGTATNDDDSLARLGIVVASSVVHSTVLAATNLATSASAAFSTAAAFLRQALCRPFASCR
eukprot:2076119-Pyramimonas_sp.AAC.1